MNHISSEMGSRNSRLKVLPLTMKNRATSETTTPSAAGRIRKRSCVRRIRS
jgi:hypothetical protein